MQRLLLPPVVWFASVGAMVILQRTWPVAVLPADGRVLAWWAGGVLVLAGLVVAQWHARLFRRIGTNINTFGEPGTLTTAGLFAHTRNPMYLGMALLLSACAMWLSHPLAWLVLPGFVAYITRFQIMPEERILRGKFGEAYQRYTQTVRRWL